MHKLLTDLRAVDDGPMLIYEDNQSAICISKSNKVHGRAKHIDVKMHYTRDMVIKNKVEIKYCPTDDMLADIFTKGLPSERFSRLRYLLGIKEFK